MGQDRALRRDRPRAATHPRQGATATRPWGMALESPIPSAAAARLTVSHIGCRTLAEGKSSGRLGWAGRRVTRPTGRRGGHGGFGICAAGSSIRNFWAVPPQGMGQGARRTMPKGRRKMTLYGPLRGLALHRAGGAASRSNPSDRQQPSARAADELPLIGPRHDPFVIARIDTQHSIGKPYGK